MTFGLGKSKTSHLRALEPPVPLAVRFMAAASPDKAARWWQPASFWEPFCPTPLLWHDATDGGEGKSQTLGETSLSLKLNARVGFQCHAGRPSFPCIAFVSC